MGNKFALGPTAQATLMFHKIWKEWLSSFTSLDAIAPCCVVPHSHFTSHVIDIANPSSMIPKSSETLKSSEIEQASSETFKSKCIDLCYVYVYAFQHTVEILSHSCSFALYVCLLDCKIVSECQFWKFWAHECERISTAISIKEFDFSMIFKTW